MYMCNEILFSLKNGDPVICNSLDKHGGNYAKRKLNTEGERLLDLTYMWDIKKSNS
jgi:hypothetical protein